MGGKLNFSFLSLCRTRTVYDWRSSKINSGYYLDILALISLIFYVSITLITLVGLNGFRSLFSIVQVPLVAPFVGDLRYLFVCACPEILRIT